MSIEVRFDDYRKVDEVLGEGCSVHLERLDSNAWCLILETSKGRNHFSIRGKGVNVTIVETAAPSALPFACVRTIVCAGCAVEDRPDARHKANCPAISGEPLLRPDSAQTVTPEPS